MHQKVNANFWYWHKISALQKQWPWSVYTKECWKQRKRTNGWRDVLVHVGQACGEVEGREPIRGHLPRELSQLYYALPCRPGECNFKVMQNEVPNKLLWFPLFTYFVDGCKWQFDKTRSFGRLENFSQKGVKFVLVKWPHSLKILFRSTFGKTFQIIPFFQAIQSWGAWKKDKRIWFKWIIEGCRKKT